MNDRKKNRDILDELFKERHDKAAPEVDGLERLIRRIAQPPRPGSGPASNLKADAAPQAAPKSGSDRTPPAPLDLGNAAAPEAPAAKAAPIAKRAPAKPSRSAKKANGRRKAASKRKSTHYLSKDTYEDLSQAKKSMRKLMPGSLRTGISKSLIVDSALKLLLEEFESKGGESALVKKILDEKEGK